MSIWHCPFWAAFMTCDFKVASNSDTMHDSAVSLRFEEIERKTEAVGNVSASCFRASTTTGREKESQRAFNPALPLFCCCDGNRDHVRNMFVVCAKKVCHPGLYFISLSICVCVCKFLFMCVCLHACELKPPTHLNQQTTLKKPYITYLHTYV